MNAPSIFTVALNRERPRAMQSLFLRSVAIVQFYMWYSGEITKSNAVVRCWHFSDMPGLTDDVGSWG